MIMTAKLVRCPELCANISQGNVWMHYENIQVTSSHSAFCQFVEFFTCLKVKLFIPQHPFFIKGGEYGR